MSLDSIQNVVSIARVLWRAFTAIFLFSIAHLALAQQVLTPATISFGNVPLTVSVTQTGTFTNNSTFQSVTITALSTSDARFVAVGSGVAPCNVGAVLPFGANCTYALTFTPTGTGTYNNTTSVAYNLVAVPQPPLTQASSGTGFTPPSTISPASILFGNVPLTVISNQTFTFTNNSDTTLFPASYTLTSFATAGLGFSAVGSGGTPCAVGLVLPPAASCQGTASFQIGGPGSSNGTTTIGFQTGQGANPVFNTSVPLNGTGFVPPSTLSPPSISFGGVIVGVPATQSFSYTNTSDLTAFPSTYTVTNLSTTGLGYSALGSGANPCVINLMLAAGASCGVTVTFVPAGAGASGGSTDIAFLAGLGTNPPYSQSVSLSGTGLPAPAVTITGSGTFPNTTLGQSSAVQSITITNSGGSTLVLNSITHSNASVFPDTTGGPAPNAAHWCGFGSAAGGAPNTGAPINIAPGGTCVMNLIFAPNATGALSGTIIINSNAATSPTSISVSGTGLAPPTPTMTVAFSPPTVAAGTPLTLVVTITNPAGTSTTLGGSSVSTTAPLNITGSGTNTCALSGGLTGNTYSFGMATIPPAGTCTINLPVLSTVPGSFSVNVVPGNLVSTPNGNNANSSTATLTVTAAGPFAYIPIFNNFTGSTVSVIDLPTNTLAMTIPVGAGPVAAVMNSTSTRVYVSNQQGNSISVIDTSSNTVIATIPVGSQPGGIALNPAGTKLFVPNQTSNNLSVIDTATNTVLGTIGGLTFPDAATVNPSGTRLYVTLFSANALAVIDTSTGSVLANVPVPGGAYAPLINSAGTKVYVLGNGGVVSVVDTATNTVTATIAVGSNARGIALNPAGTVAYVTNSGSNNVSILDLTTNTVAATVAAGNTPWGVAGNAAGTRMYVVNNVSNDVSVFDTSTNTIIATVPVGSGPVGGGQFLAPAAVAPAPAISLAPPTLTFGARTVITTSPVQTVTLTNSGNANLVILGISSSGDFGFTTTCPISTPPIAPLGTCAINITFTPLTVAALTGSITITSNAPGSPNTITLTGTGSAVPVPAVSLGATTINLGSQPVNTSSAIQSIAVSNTGFATLVLGSITKTGSGAFTRASPASPSPDCTASVAPGATCYISVIFTPTALGAATAQINIASNAASSPDIVTLTGTGIPAAIPAIGVAGSVAFGDQIINTASNPQALSILSSGTAALNVSGIALSGTDAGSFATSGACAAIAVGASCPINITFTPTSVGAKTAQLTIASDASGQPATTVSLAGNGILAPRPVVGLSTTAIGFGNAIFGGATPGQVVTVSNSGGLALQIQNLYTVGDFVQMNSCPASLSSGASCLINVLFSPLAVGGRSGELVLITNAANSPHRVPLSGTGCRWFSQPQSRLFLTTCGN